MPTILQSTWKTGHAQQLDNEQFLVAAWLDDREVLRRFLLYLFVFMCVRQGLFIVVVFLIFKMIHNFLKLIEIDESSSFTYAQHIAINMKNWHAQQLDNEQFLVAAWLDDHEVLRRFLLYLFVFMCVRKSLFIVVVFLILNRAN